MRIVADEEVVADAQKECERSLQLRLVRVIKILGQWYYGEQQNNLKHNATQNVNLIAVFNLSGAHRQSIVGKDQ